MIARSASGSFRDALGTLDQLVAFGGNEVGLDEVLEMLGAADAELLFEAVDAVVAEDPKAVLLGVEKMARSGRDPVPVRPRPARPPAPPAGHPDDRRGARLLRRHRHRLGRGCSARPRRSAPATLVRTIDELAGALTAVREGDDARMAVEIALLKAARPDLDPSTEGLLRRIERLERRLGRRRRRGSCRGRRTRREPAPAPQRPDAEPPPPAAAAARPERRAEPPSRVRRPQAAPEPSPRPRSELRGRGGLRRQDPPARRLELDLEKLKRVWPAVLESCARRRRRWRRLFEGARPVGVRRRGAWSRSAFPPSATFNKRKAEAPEQRERCADGARGGHRRDAAADLRPARRRGATPAAAEAPAAGAMRVDEEELLERLKSEFDAEEVS